MAKVVEAPVKLVNKPFEGAEHFLRLDKVAAVVGKGAKGVIKFTDEAIVKEPALHFITQIAQGKNIAQAAKIAVHDGVKEFAKAGPIAQSIVSVIPGVGTAVGVAIGAGVALAQGKPISEIMIDAAAGAVPGGLVAADALHAGAKIGGDLLSHKNIKTALLDGARSAAIDAGSAVGIPPIVTSTAFDTGIALGHAKKIQDVGMELAHVAVSEAAKATGVPIPPVLTSAANDMITAAAKHKSIEKAAIKTIEGATTKAAAKGASDIFAQIAPAAAGGSDDNSDDSGDLGLSYGGRRVSFKV